MAESTTGVQGRSYSQSGPTGKGARPPRQRRSAETVLNIEHHAVALVLEHGLENVTVEMICDASGVSQRTFFNYFATKDAAILGNEVPHIDEQRARAFIGSEQANLLEEALTLIALPSGDIADPKLAAARLRAIAANPTLLHKQMERFAVIETEMADILYFRLRRTAPSSELPEQTRELAALATQILAGIFRYTAISAANSDGAGGGTHLRHTIHLLESLFPRLRGLTSG